MKISERPEFAAKPKPLMFAPDKTVAEAVARMSEFNFGSVMIVDHDERLLGVVTERDVLKRLVNAGLDPKTTPLAQIMTSDIRVAKKDDDVLDWLRIMSNERFRRLPVVDDDNRVQAVMTQGDFVSYTWPDLIHQAKQITRATIGSNYGLMTVLVGICFYTIAIVGFVSIL